MQGEMKTVTFTLVCAPGQEGPLRKVTLPALAVHTDFFTWGKWATFSLLKHLTVGLTEV